MSVVSTSSKKAKACLVAVGQDGEPGEHGPEAVLFAHVVAPRPERLLPAHAALVCGATPHFILIILLLLFFISEI